MIKKLFFVLLTASSLLLGCSGDGEAIKKLQGKVQEQHTENVVLYILLPVILLAGVFIGTVVGAKARRDSDKEHKERGNG